MRTTIVPVRFSTRARRFLKCLSRKSWRRIAESYIIGTIYLIRFRSISEIARCVRVAVDTLHHFMRNSPWNPSDIQRSTQKDLAGRISGKPLKLIIDDTPVKRNGKHIEGLGVHHGPSGLSRGLCAVTSVIRFGSSVFAWAVVGYRRMVHAPTKPQIYTSG